MSKVLVIDEIAIAALQRIKKYAEENMIDLANLRRISEGMTPPLADNVNHSCHIRDGFKVVFSIEEQPVGWCRHISASVNTRTTLPRPESMLEFMKHLGFKCKAVNEIKGCESVWIEEDRKPMVINIVEKI